VPRRAAGGKECHRGPAQIDRRARALKPGGLLLVLDSGGAPPDEGADARLVLVTRARAREETLT